MTNKAIDVENGIGILWSFLVKNRVGVFSGLIVILLIATIGVVLKSPLQAEQNIQSSQPIPVAPEQPNVTDTPTIVSEEQRLEVNLKTSRESLVQSENILAEQVTSDFRAYLIERANKWMLYASQNHQQYGISVEDYLRTLYTEQLQAAQAAMTGGNTTPDFNVWMELLAVELAINKSLPRFGINELPTSSTVVVNNAGLVTALKAYEEAAAIYLSNNAALQNFLQSQAQSQINQMLESGVNTNAN